MPRPQNVLRNIWTALISHKKVKVGRGFNPNPNLFLVRPVGSKSQIYVMASLTLTTLFSSSSRQSRLRWRREWCGSVVAGGIKGLHPDQLFTACNQGLWEFSIVIIDLSLRSSMLFVCSFIIKTMLHYIWMPPECMRTIHTLGFWPVIHTHMGFCRAEILAVSCHFFFKSRAFVWLNLIR